MEQVSSNFSAIGNCQQCVSLISELRCYSEMDASEPIVKASKQLGLSPKGLVDLVSTTCSTY